MKLTYKDKVKIYKEWKHKHKSPKKIAAERNLASTNIDYMVHLADIHGIEILKHKSRKYSVEFKEKAVRRALNGKRSTTSISLELGLTNQGTLPRWIKEYKENGYTVVERKRGRHGKKDKDSSRIRERTAGTTAEELEAYNRERILKKIRCLGNGKREIRKEEIAEVITLLRQELKCSVKVIMEVIHSDQTLPQITKSDYYYQCSKTDKDEKNDSLMNMIIAIYYAHKCRYGYRRVHLELRKRGIEVNVKKVRRLMRRMGLAGRKRNRRKYSSYKGTQGKIAVNIIQRDFFSDTPNKKWYTDVTEFNLRGEKLYLSPILDGCGGDIVAYSISISPNLKQTMEMLDKAFSKHEDLKGLIMHTDQGWQYQHASYVNALEQHGIIQSMSRKGNSMDNGLMENFFGLLKTEMFYDQESEYATLEDLEIAIEEYIDYYNNERIKDRLKGMTPIEYRNHALLTD